MIDQLTGALATLSGGAFTSFSSVQRESAAAGARVDALRPGAIVVGRYKGLMGLKNTIGYGRWATDDHDGVTAGAVFLDRDFDKSNELRRLLRTHELGHALGYRHVTTRASIMNPTIGPDITEFDRQGAGIAFQRQPGNQSPDDDTGARSGSGGGVFGVTSTGRRVDWGPRVD